MFLNNKGRTIIEMITVVIILGIISAVAYPMIFMNERILNRQIKESATRNDVRGLENFLKDDLRNSKNVGIRLIDDNDSDLYSYTLIVADTSASEIIYKREKRADDSLYLVRQKDNQKIDFTDVKGLEIDKDTNNSRLIDVKITTLDDRGEELKHEFKVARWQWLMAKEESSQPGGVIDFIVDDNVFVMGGEFTYTGGNVSGEGATVLIKGGLGTGIPNWGDLKVSNIFVEKNLHIKHGSLSLGNESSPGEIIVNGNATIEASAPVYGDLFVQGDLYVNNTAVFYGNVYIQGKLYVNNAGTFREEVYVEDDMIVNNNPTFYKNVYVNGDLIQNNGGSAYFNNGSSINYYGIFTYPNNGFENNDNYKPLTSKIDVLKKEVPNYSMPAPRDEAWYIANGYSEDGPFVSDAKIYTKQASLSLGVNGAQVRNVVIVSLNGNLTINVANWGSPDSVVSGVFFAPNGKITITAREIEGLILAQNGFKSVNETIMTFKGLEDFTGPGKIFASEADYPFTNP